jgi:hypothetical protein
MKIKGILILVLALFFLLGATLSIPNGFVMKWGVESVYAKNNNNHPGPGPGYHPGPGPGYHPGPGHDPGPGYSNGYGHHPGHGPGHSHGHGGKSVPEPSTLILLGIGLAAVGGYTALKSKKNKENN